MTSKECGPIPQSQTDHILALDGIRGIAILMVTLYRFLNHSFSSSEYGSLVGRLIQLGSIGVDLFFVLSGFLITNVLLNSKGSPDFFRRFYYRRSLRIFPLYFASLFLFLYLVPAVSGTRLMFAEPTKNQLYLWTYTSNLKMAWQDLWCFGYLDHFWTLAIEEQFYLVWPIVVYCCGMKRLLWTALLSAGLCILARTMFCYVSNNGVAADVFTLFRCEGLLFGAAISVLFLDQSKSALLLKSASWVFAQGNRTIKPCKTFTCLPRGDRMRGLRSCIAFVYL